MTGMPVYLGADQMSATAFVQIAGRARRMKARLSGVSVKDSEPLTRLLNRYAQGLFNQVAQTAACNRAHSAEERATRLASRRPTAGGIGDARRGPSGSCVASTGTLLRRRGRARWRTAGACVRCGDRLPSRLPWR
jgi:hypothetical protein